MEKENGTLDNVKPQDVAGMSINVPASSIHQAPPSDSVDSKCSLIGNRNLHRKSFRSSKPGVRIFWAVLNAVVLTKSLQPARKLIPLTIRTTPTSSRYNMMMTVTSNRPCLKLGDDIPLTKYWKWLVGHLESQTLTICKFQNDFFVIRWLILWCRVRLALVVDHVNDDGETEKILHPCAGGSTMAKVCAQPNSLFEVVVPGNSDEDWTVNIQLEPSSGIFVPRES